MGKFTLWDQHHRILEFQLAEDNENTSRFPKRGSSPQTALAGIAQYREKVDNADSELESGNESNGDYF